jgi:ABC-type branched-subunit amino acid transport system ATPase component/branched-subunit amino acid ABC-type transport system permease component
MYLLLALTGLGAGVVYAGIAISLVTTYKGTGIINFAAGAMGMWSAFVFDELVRNGNLVFPWVIVPSSIHIGAPSVPVALTIALAEAVALGLAAHFLIFKHLRSQPALAKVVASVGLMLTLQSLVVIRFGSRGRTPDPILPHDSVHILGQTLSQQYLWAAAAVVVVAALLWAYFRFTRLGIATRAASENEPYVVLAGISPDLLAAVTWAAASFSVGLLVILASPIVLLDSTAFIAATVPALAAALVARFTSIIWAAAAGLALGAMTSILSYVTAQSWWPNWAQAGFTSVFPFLVVIVVLFFLGQAIPARGTSTPDALPRVPTPRTDLRFVLPVLAFGLVAILVTQGGYRFGVITSMIVSIGALSLVVLTGLIGQTSLATAGLAGVGGFLLSKLADQLHIPFPIGPVLAAAGAAVFGLMIGLPALRIRGAQLAVVTLAASLALEQFIFNNSSFSGQLGAPVPPPTLFGINLSVRQGTTTARWQFGLLVLLVVAAVALAVANLIRSDTGKAFMAIRSNERASSAAGIAVTTNKLLAFAIASFLAGLCGAFIGYSRGQISGESFSSNVSIAFLVYAYLGGITSVSGAMVAGLLAPLGIGYVAINRLLPQAGNGYVLVASVGLITTAMFNPEGISRVFAVQWTSLKKKFGRARDGQTGPAVAVGNDGARNGEVGGGFAAGPPRRTRTIADEPALVVGGLTVVYGGLRAVADVSLRIAGGEIVGLIGPNGAGKTSIVDAVTGFTRSAGKVLVAGHDLSRLSPHERARSGLSRTWQSVELFRDLSIKDNIAVTTSRPSTVSAVRDLLSPRSRAGTEALWAASLLGVDQYLDMWPNDLSLGQQKLVGVARALAPHPTVVILDEPAAGLDSRETASLGEHIEAIAAEGTAVLLIDHDMELVLEVCDRVYVIDFGRLIASGTPDEIRRDQRVVAAYLGQEAVVEGQQPDVSEAATLQR